MKSILNLSAKEIVLFDALTKLANEAIEAEKLINEHFKSSFGFGNKVIHVYHTESCGEYYGDGYLNIDGNFEYHDNWWGGRTYKFNCDADGIYQMFRSCYLHSNSLDASDPCEFNCQIENIDGYFREFVKSLSDDGKRTPSDDKSFNDFLSELAGE